MQIHPHNIDSAAQDDNHGFALITTLFMMSALVALLGAYAMLTSNELISDKYSSDSMTGFYVAEAGLNVRAEDIRQTFVGFNRPTGTSPTGDGKCFGANIGAGDYACEDFTFAENHSATTYIVEEPGNPLLLTIPPGERYQYLTAQEYRYNASSIARNQDGTTEANLELHFKSRLVPLFQFAAFYNKDLEILPGPTMTLAGPVHANGDLYLNVNAGSPGLTIQGQVTTAGLLYRGRKDQNQCSPTPVRIYNPTTPVSLIPSCSTRVNVTQAQINPYNKMIQKGVPAVTVPPPEEFDAVAGGYYWDNADLRLVLNLNAAGNVDTANSVTGVEVRLANDTVDATRTNNLHACAGSISGRPVGTSNTFYNNREHKWIRMLEVDTQALLNCIHTQNLLDSGGALNEDTHGGLVFYLTVKGPLSNTINHYGFRLRNASNLRSSVGGAPTPKGISFISDQAGYTWGHFNSVNKIPAALMVDSINVLSTGLTDANSNSANLTPRTAVATTINSAFLAGTDTTGGIEGIGGQNGAYNGGLENYPRFHENWNSRTLTYVGSFVSLGRPRHVNGAWIYGSPYYNAPTRAWGYDTSFNNAANLPPITPRFVYLRQELFVRQYESN